MDRQTRWVVLTVQDWDFEPARIGLIPVEVDCGKMCGYLPVYATEEEARQEFPESKYIQVFIGKEQTP